MCTFHSWSYDLEGALVAVPDEFQFSGLDRGERGLVPVRCETWLGCIFVNEDPGAIPLKDDGATHRVRVVIGKRRGSEGK